MKVGNKVFYANEPVLYFDTLKTSTLEGASTTVYAQGGRGNARLVAWDGDRTMTFTMEDALISAEGFMILSGAGLIEASAEQTIKQHFTETTVAVDYDEGETKVSIYTKNLPYENVDATGKRDGQYYIYAMIADDEGPMTEPYLPHVVRETGANTPKKFKVNTDGTYAEDAQGEFYCLEISAIDTAYKTEDNADLGHELSKFDNATVLLDYYIERSSNAKQIEITAESFGGNFYLEASTLFRTRDGVDMPAEFIIPNCKIQSNFTFTMAPTGDPSTFTFTLDAFPGTTRFNPTKKVLAAIQIIEDALDADLLRTQTIHDPAHDSYFDI